MSRGLFDLSGKVVLATGANSGLGLAFLRGCAKHGADVALWSRRKDKNAEAARELRALGASRVHAEAADVSDEGAVAAAFASTLDALGRVDCVFANAGFSNRAESFPDLSSRAYHELIAVNLHGAFYTLREAARHMRDRARAGDPGGSIVACGSLSMFEGHTGMEHYAASKGALGAMIKGLAVEMGQYGVRANMLAPGFILTGFHEGNPQVEALKKRFSEVTPMGRAGRVDDIEGAAVYLASDASAFHTGDILVIDGGRLVNSV